MRIWDIPPSALCRQHLLGEHRELHCIYTVLIEGRRGYSRHPETLRWVGHLPALRDRHERLVAEMRARGYRHASELPHAAGAEEYPVGLISVDEQRELLRRKGCICRL